MTSSARAIENIANGVSGRALQILSLLFHKQ